MGPFTRCVDILGAKLHTPLDGAEDRPDTLDLTDEKGVETLPTMRPRLSPVGGAPDEAHVAGSERALPTTAARLDTPVSPFRTSRETPKATDGAAQDRLGQLRWAARPPSWPSVSSRYPTLPTR